VNQTPKIWGSTCKLFDKNNVEVHRIQVIKGCFCSKHWHRYKHNRFYVESGELHIIVWDKGGRATCHCLQDGDVFTVPPRMLHRFEGNQDSVAYEIYWAELDADIIRLEPGGINATAQLDAAMKEIGSIMDGKAKI